MGHATELAPLVEGAEVSLYLLHLSPVESGWGGQGSLLPSGPAVKSLCGKGQWRWGGGDRV